MPPPPPFIRFAFCCNLLKRSLNLRRNSVRSLAYATCSDVSDSSSDTNVSCQPLGKSKVIETFDQLDSEWRSAFLFLRDQLQDSGSKPTYISVARLVSHWDWGIYALSNNLPNDVTKNKSREIETFEISDHLFESLMEGKLIKAVQVLVKLYASVGRFEEAIHAMSEMKRRSGLMVSTHTCNFVMTELYERDKVDMVESVYKQMKGNGLIPNVYTYGMLIRVHCKKGRLKEASRVFAQMEEAGVEPKAFIYTPYIEGLCTKRKPVLAYQVLKKLRDSNKPVDAFAYVFVILGFLKKSKLKAAEDVFFDMKLREVVPNAHRCYDVLIAAYCRKGDIVKALVLCKEMESRGIKTLGHFSMRSMMQCLFRLGMFAEALYVFKHFRKQSRPIDEASFKIAIDCACKLGEMDEAMGLVEEMKGRRIKPFVMQH